ncbi:MAG TPA: cation-transporting P-type ATPase, partial [Anaerolineales bacterium]
MSATPIYSLRVPEVWNALETSPSGLSEGEVLARLSLYGQNLLYRQEKKPTAERFFHYMLHPSALVLLMVGLAGLLERDVILALIIWSIVLVNSAFSFWREHRAEQAIDKLRLILPSFAHVVREGIEHSIPASEVVPGDLMVLAEGDNIAADARVIEEYGLRTNNATLTGEAIPARKLADPSHQEGLSELDRPNLIFAGTSVASGTGRAVVTATGMSTEFGRIAHLTQSIQEEPTPFQKELNRLSRRTAWIALMIGAIVASVGYFQLGFQLKEVTLLAFGIIVAVIPEGLTATLTLSLAAAVQRLAGKGVLAKRLSTVERLGQVSVICTDKSGTLTQNQMTVRDLWVARQKVRLSGAGYEPEGEFTPAPAGKAWEPDLRALLEVAILCNNSRLNPPSVEHAGWTSLGDQTEAALKVAALKGGLSQEQLELRLPRVHEIPFDARRKRMTTVHRGPEGERAFVKGAPREVLQHCSHVLIHGQPVPLTAELRAEILGANDEYARRALRVLALARRDLSARLSGLTAENVEKDLIFLGLMAMLDPPRPQVEKAIRT